ADETITRRYGGSGLGLSIARSLAKMMDGDIHIDSTQGKGSIFRAVICLDHCETCDATEEVNIAPVETRTAAQGNEILLVEDYAPNIMVATMILEDLGYVVTSAENGTRAIAVVEQRMTPFNAILMDVQMHGMDGLETTRRIRDIEKNKGFRHTIIGVTAHALAGDRERCINAGMDDYVSKPIHPDILAKKLRVLT
ncbi:MAG: ATP-binding response regulator, partial [Rickettsiales bacterium]